MAKNYSFPMNGPGPGRRASPARPFGMPAWPFDPMTGKFLPLRPTPEQAPAFSRGGAGGKKQAAVVLVSMSRTGGDAGDAKTGCSFTYALSVGGNAVASGVNPGSAPHLCQRAAKGKYVAATAGAAVVQGGQYVVIACNEVFEVEACEGGDS